jgi:ATP-dependent RNA helicase DDX42
LRGCEIVCGTPGRIIDMVRYKNGGIPNLNRVTMVIIDEADKLLSMGFEMQVSSILQSIRPDAQRCFVSATFSNRMKRLLADRWASTTNNLYAHLSVGTTGTSSEHVAQHVVVLPTAQSKREWLTNHLPSLIFDSNDGSEGKRQINKKNKAIIFVSTRIECEEVSQMLQRHLNDIYGDKIIGSLHGDKHQLHRNETLGSFRKGNISILVATDVAARGLDIEHVNFVINFDPAKNMDSHVHRIGRAGRMVGQVEDDPKGNSGGCHTHAQGVAYTLLTCKDADFAHLLLEAFTREGRHISAELTDLAKKSKYHKITPYHLDEKHGVKRSRTS